MNGYTQPDFYTVFLVFFIGPQGELLKKLHVNYAYVVRLEWVGAEMYLSVVRKAVVCRCTYL